MLPSMYLGSRVWVKEGKVGLVPFVSEMFLPPNDDTGSITGTCFFSSVKQVWTDAAGCVCFKLSGATDRVNEIEGGPVWGSVLLDFSSARHETVEIVVESSVGKMAAPSPLLWVSFS